MVSVRMDVLLNLYCLFGEYPKQEKFYKTVIDSTLRILYPDDKFDTRAQYNNMSKVTNHVDANIILDFMRLSGRQINLTFNTRTAINCLVALFLCNYHDIERPNSKQLESLI